MSAVIVIVPTYNEFDNIGLLLSKLLTLSSRINVIVVDDNSPDGTAQVAKEWVRRSPDKVMLIQRERKMGLGTAYLAGFKKALALSPELIVTMDADFSHDPQYIEGMLGHAPGHDLVIGSRYVTGGSVLDSPWHRRLLSRSANQLARTALALQPNDVTAGFRAYRANELAKLDLEQILSDGYSFLIEMLFLCQTAGWRIKEIPIAFKDRAHGISKISRKEIVKALLTIGRLLVRRPFPQRRAASGQR